MTTTFRCQFMPPSTNSLFPTVGRGKAMRRVISEAYKGWKTAAGLELNRAKLKPFTKPVAIKIIIGKLPANADLSNRIKAPEDLLVAHGIIPGDSIKWVRRIEIELSDEPFEGFEVCISEISKEARKAA